MGSEALEGFSLVERLTRDLARAVEAESRERKAELRRAQFSSSPALEDADEAAVQERLGAFYRDLLWELEEFAARSGSTVTGFGVIAKRVALAHGVAGAKAYPLPRLSRSQLVEQGKARK